MNIESAYQAYSQGVYRYALMKTSNKELAEDITAEAFVKLLQTDTQFVDEAHQRQWLFKVVRNLITDQHRRGNNAVSISTLDQEGHSLEEKLPDKTELENIVIDEMMYTKVLATIQKLDEEIREVIILRLWEELSFAEIAIITGDKEDTVKKRFYRGIEKLKQLMTESEGQKTRAIALPIIVAGLMQLAKDPSYQMSSTFSSNLFINLRNMPEGQPVSLLAKLKLFLASKWGIALLAFLGISAIALIALIIALVSNRPGGNGNGNTSSSATTVATSSATTAANSAATSSGPRTQNRLLFNPNEIWFGGSRPYPAELRNLYDDQLQQVTCSDQAYGYGFENPNSAADYKGVEDDRPIQDSELISLINSLNAALNTKVNDVFRCKTADSKVIAVYNVWAGGGGMDSIGYTGYVQNNLVPNPVAIPNDGPAYFSCRGMLAILNDGAYYVRCGGGDGTGGSSSIYLIDPAARTKGLTEKCDIDGMTVTCSN